MYQETWRLIPALTLPGPLQMAIDDWLLDQLVAGLHPPVLRFYRWQRAALSLGYHQRQRSPHWETITWQGQRLDLVRRPTGGRAVLHQGDFTYAIALPLQNRRRQAIYQLICDALIAAWQDMGVPLHYGNAGRGYHQQASCFALATPADLVTETGYKLIGSAQLRRDHSLLQQGTMRLWPSKELHQAVFKNPLDTSHRPDAMPKEPSENWSKRLEATIIQMLSQQLDVTFQVAPLTPAEMSQIQARCDRFRIPSETSPKPVA
ncbi:MAG: lipoate--protein ligase family protein [Cyanobacteria bacterium J06638_20]